MSKIIPGGKFYSKKNVKIGVLGGTFDPPHLAHLHMAEQAQKDLGLDFVVFMPIGIPPHNKKNITDAYHRINMLKILLHDHNDFFIDDYEANLGEPSYTVNTVERIKRQLGKDSVMYFIIGADSLLDLEKWYAAERLLEITNFAVIPREGYTDKKCLNYIEKLEKKYEAEIKYLGVKKLNYSSTDVRDNPGLYDYETKQAVIKYIKENKLYDKSIREKILLSNGKVLSGKAERKKIIGYLNKNINPKRVDHILGTAECAVEMAQAYGVDYEKAEAAALLHDCAKESSDDTLLKKARKIGFEIDDMYLQTPQLLHGAAGALISKEKFGISDPEILEAISYHTVPKPGMCDLAKIIYVADKIEKTRTFTDLKEIRDAVGKKTLDCVFLMTLKRVKLAHIMNNKTLHPSSLETYNELVSSLNKC